MKAIVNYKGALSYFSIKRERPGIYQADLVYYDGDEKIKPPTEITMLRGIRNWSGSVKDKILLNELGKIIDDSLSKQTK